jgi:four helix bundle protein
MRDFKELNVWKKAHQMVMEVYRITANFPSDERFGLVAQLRRSAASVPANIAEGCGRNSDPDLSRFLSIAAGSASETEYHMFLAHDLKLIDKNDYSKSDKQINEIKRMLNVFIQKLKNNT